MIQVCVHVVVNSVRGLGGIFACSARERLCCVDTAVGRGISLSDGQSCKPPRYIQIGVPAVASNLQVVFSHNRRTCGPLKFLLWYIQTGRYRDQDRDREQMSHNLIKLCGYFHVTPEPKSEPRPITPAHPRSHPHPLCSSLSLSRSHIRSV